MREDQHCLSIGRCEVTDQGVYTARTNTEETSCSVHISGGTDNHKNYYNLPSFRVSTQVHDGSYTCN